MNFRMGKKTWIFSGVVVYAAVWFFFLLRNLDRLSLWMDEGFHWLAVDAILKNGLTLYPSGHMYYKAIFYCYVLALFALILGLSTFTLRFFSVLCFAALIPVLYRFARKLVSEPVAVMAALMLPFSAWSVEYARSALYFVPLMLVTTLGLLLFYETYFEDVKKTRVGTWIVFAAAPLVHQLGVGLLFAFVALALVKGVKRLFRKDVFGFFLATGVYYVAVQLHEFYFWKVGYVYERTDDSLAGLFKYYVSGFSLDYFRELSRAMPLMSLVVTGGAFLYLGSRLVRRPDDQTGDAAARNAQGLYLYTCLIFPMLFLGFLRTHVQPRYLSQLYPLFLVIFLATLYHAAPVLVDIVLTLFGTVRKPGFRKAAALIVFVGLSIALAEGFGWKRVSAIVNRKYGDRITTDVLTRTGRFEQEDHRTTGEFVRRHLRDDDIVIAIHVVFEYIYAGRVDYWLWSGGPGTWDAWEETADGWKDFYVGARWINNLADLKRIIGEKPGRRVWLITSTSIDRRDHISRDIADFIREDPAELVFLGQDGVSAVYLFNDALEELTRSPHTYEAEWIPNPPGKIVYEPKASKGCVLALESSGKKTGENVSLSIRLPGTRPAGRYRCVLRAAGKRNLSPRALSAAVSGGKENGNIRTFSISGQELDPGIYKDYAFDVYLRKEGPVEIRLNADPDSGIRLDALDFIPEGKQAGL